MLDCKQLFMIGGPNGSGKTTSAYMLMPELICCDEYVNADAIAASLSPFNPSSIAIKSGKLMLARICELVDGSRNFAFEATMASRSFVHLIKDCKHKGYQINLLYVWVADCELAINRVNFRVASRGHSIPPDVIKRRYYRSMSNFTNLYAPLADRWALCDNSDSVPAIIAQKHKSQQNVEIYDEDYWCEFNKAIL